MKINHNWKTRTGVKIKKPILLFLFSSLFILSSCTEPFNFGSLPKPGNQNNNNDNKVVRGPSGVGSGGGVIIVENNGVPLSGKKYEVYLEENGSMENLQNGFSDEEGKIQLSETKLTAEKIRKLQDGAAKLIVEVYNGNVKTAVRGRVIVNTENGNDIEIDLGSA